MGNVERWPEKQTGDLDRQLVYTGFGTVLGAIFRQRTGTSRRVYRAEHRSGRWARFTGRNAAMSWLSRMERGETASWDGEAEAWNVDPSSYPGGQ